MPDFFVTLLKRARSSRVRSMLSVISFPSHDIWAVRCMHEAQMFESNCFITLTYSSKHLPFVKGTDVPTLVLSDYQKFMKRLRKRFHGHEVVRGATHDNYCSVSWPIRFFHCGEYGEKKGRPHYHACLFNFDFVDKRPWRKSPTGHMLYRSESLEEFWPYGNCEIGSVTFQSAACIVTGKQIGRAHV